MRCFPDVGVFKHSLDLGGVDCSKDLLPRATYLLGLGDDRGPLQGDEEKSHDPSSRGIQCWYLKLCEGIHESFRF